MISLTKMFSEAANVPCEHPSGITAPIGTVIHPSERSKLLLSHFQDINKLDLDTQAKELNKLRGT